MKMPAAIWKMTYSADRRKHNHRCRRCSRIVQDGEQVWMARVIGRKTKVLHIDCATKPFDSSMSQYSEYDLLECHGMEYLAACGWKDAQDLLDRSPLTKPRAAA